MKNFIFILPLSVEKYYNIYQVLYLENIIIFQKSNKMFEFENIVIFLNNIKKNRPLNAV